MKTWWRGAVVFLAACVMSLVAITPAQAGDGYDGYWPWTGRVDTELVGDYHAITLNFKLNQIQLENLRNAGEYLEIDFIVYDAGIKGDSGDYTFYSNIPTARKDIPFLDRTFTPGATAIETRQLSANTEYWASINWNSSYGTVPQISVDFVPSEWATVAASSSKSYSSYSGNGIIQTASCTWGFLGNDIGWCIFPVERRKLLATLYGGLVSADGRTYTLDPSVLDRSSIA